MTKLNVRGAYEVLARNYCGTDTYDHKPYGMRAALRSDGTVLTRTRWTTGWDGARDNRGGEYRALRGRVKAEALEEVLGDTERATALVDRLMARMGLTPEIPEPKPETPISPQPQYGSLREKITAEKAERAARYAEFEVLHRRACEAGRAAAEAALPAPMLVAERANQFDDTSPVANAWVVSEGCCGFAWVRLARGNSSFAHWAAKNAGFHNGQLWVHDFGQSLTRKEAFARAYADTLREAGIVAYAQSRMD